MSIVCRLHSGPARQVLYLAQGAALRHDMLALWRGVNDRLREALASWDEKDLDTVRMPHPLLGKITAREMIYFTLYHAEHHVAATRQRLPRLAGPGGEE